MKPTKIFSSKNREGYLKKYSFAESQIVKLNSIDFHIFSEFST